MKLTRLIVEGFKKIVATDFTLDEHVTEITGDNEQGKSSHLDAIWLLIDGKRVAPAEIIRKGQDRCTIRGEFGELIVTRTFRRGRKADIIDSLRIEKGDETFDSTETQLKKLIGEHMLDPGEFITLDRKGKFDALKMFCPDVPFEQLARQHKADYDRRTDVNKLATDARSAAAMIAVPDGIPDAETDTSELLEQLTEASKANAQTQALKVKIAGFRSEANSLLNEASELRRQAQVLREQARVADERAQTSFDQATNLAGQTDLIVVPELLDIDAKRQEIDKANKANVQVRRKLERQKHLTTAETYEKESAEISARIKSRQEAKEAAIAASNIPIEGLTFGDGEVFLDGLPFDQASTARKIRVGVQVAVHRNPTLRLVWIRDASLFDDRSYGLVREIAREFDCQILLETVRKIGKDAIVIENGMIKKASEGAQQHELLTPIDDEGCSLSK
jgi:hypothetical protein